MDVETISPIFSNRAAVCIVRSRPAIVLICGATGLHHWPDYRGANRILNLRTKRTYAPHLARSL